ncbi:hypothetical protein JM654_17885 [Microbacterium oxydans]|nr:hypothetical protein [Microbacterium oxydans]
MRPLPLLFELPVDGSGDGDGDGGTTAAARVKSCPSTDSPTSEIMTLRVPAPTIVVPSGARTISS